VPGLDDGASGEVIEAQVGRRKHLGQHDYLTGVHREVFGDVEDGFQNVDFAALDCSFLE
jgi:hypothetical protein